MRMIQGTPKTLREAIQNALNDCPFPSPKGVDEIIELHVLDFLAQKFTTILVGAPTQEAEKSVSDLRDKIWPEKKC